MDSRVEICCIRVACQGQAADGGPADRDSDAVGRGLVPGLSWRWQGPQAGVRQGLKGSGGGQAYPASR